MIVVSIPSGTNLCNQSICSNGKVGLCPEWATIQFYGARYSLQYLCQNHAAKFVADVNALLMANQ